MSLPPTSSLYQQANQKEFIDLSFYKKNIQLSPHPRLEVPTYKWNNQKWKTPPGTTPAKCLNDLLWSKHLKFIKEGPASLVGKVAVDIAQSIVKYSNSTYTLSGITFQPNSSRTDIYANLGSQYKSYNNVIEEMERRGSATRDTANKILKNLSKANYRIPAEIFEGLDESAKRLMAFLICETIRFQEDGACARMAIRMVIKMYDDNMEDPFGTVFVSIPQQLDPASIFASKKGKNRMINQILNDFPANYPSNIKAYFEDDKNKVNQIQSDYYSDDEVPQAQSNSNFNTANEPRIFVQSAPYALHPMVKQDRVRIDEIYKDPSSNSSASSSTNPTPIRTTSYSLKQRAAPLSWDVEAISRGVAVDQEALSFTPSLINNGSSCVGNDGVNYHEEETQNEFEENQAHSSDNEEELNDSMEPSPTINNDFGEFNQGTAYTQLPMWNTDAHLFAQQPNLASSSDSDSSSDQEWPQRFRFGSNWVKGKDNRSKKKAPPEA